VCGATSAVGEDRIGLTGGLSAEACDDGGFNEGIGCNDGGFSPVAAGAMCPTAGKPLLRRTWSPSAWDWLEIWRWARCIVNTCSS
jgi:hypothetical protein